MQLISLQHPQQKSSLVFPQLSYNLLQILTPPTQQSPSLQQFSQQLDQHFIKECRKFLLQEEKLHLVSRKVEINLNNVFKTNQELNNSKYKRSFNYDKVYQQLSKLNLNQQTLKQRQSTLKMICELIRLDHIKSALLIDNQQAPKELILKTKKIISQQKSQHQKSLQPSKPMPISQKQAFLQNLHELHILILNTNHLCHLSLPLIQSILTQLHHLYNKSITKGLSSQMLTPDMIQLILGRYYQPFLVEDKIDIIQGKTVRQRFVAVMVGNRLQMYRLRLNPLINNLNYATNVIELYDSILLNWIQLLQQEIKLFQRSNLSEIVKTANKLMLVQAMPKLQKNIYKIKEIGQISYIRSRIHAFYTKLNSLQALQSKQQVSRKNQQGFKKQQSQKRQQKWQPLPQILQRMRVLLQQKIKQQSIKLCSTKYNIYSLSSYMPIRLYLQTIPNCILEQTSPLSPLAYQSPFHLLSTSRNPTTQPNNKSLIIFNLNIWYLYGVIVKGFYKEEGIQKIKYCKDRFVQINIGEVRRIYYQGLDKVLEICGNLPQFRNVLYAELNLLGHNQLRIDVANTIKFKYLTVYQQTLNKINIKSMNNQEVKVFCKTNNINLNKFGKYSNQICIYSVEELSGLLQYS